MGSALRTTALVLSFLCAGLVVLSLFLPWWSVQTGEQGLPPRDTDVYGPFSSDEQGTRRGDLETQVRVLGGLLIVGGVLALGAAARLARPAATSGWANIMLVLCAASIVLAALFVVVAFPVSAERVHGADLSFQDSRCTASGLCFRTNADTGWLVAMAAALAATAAAVLPKSVREAQAAAAPPVPVPLAPAKPPAPPAPPKVVAPSTRRPEVRPSAVGGRAVKCPQCQTRLGMSRAGPPQLVPCPNCGLRVAV